MALNRRTSLRLWSRRKSFWRNVRGLLIDLPLLVALAIVIVPYFAYRCYRSSLSAVQRLRYVVLDGTQEQLLREAARNAPLRYRWFGQSLTVEQVDREMSGRAEWERLTQRMRSGDRIWPFEINPNTLAMRAGFVVVRGREAIAIVITAVS